MILWSKSLFRSKSFGVPKGKSRVLGKIASMTAKSVPCMAVVVLFSYIQPNWQKQSVFSIIAKRSQSVYPNWNVWEILKAQNKYNQVVFWKLINKLW